MNYDALLDGICELGRRMLGCGAEIHRVEDTVHRLCSAYGLTADVFAIPNCLIVSFTDPDGALHTRMRQAKVRGTNIEGIERYNALSRRLCAQPPADPGEIMTSIGRVSCSLRSYSSRLQLLGYFVGAFFFSMFFSGGLWEALVGGLAGAAAGGCMLLLGRTRSNFFINTIVAGFLLAFVAYGLLALGLPINIQVVIVGAIMVLVPGLVFTNFMSNLLTGDIVAGLSTFARAVLTAGAIALGTGAGLSLCRTLWSIPEGAAQAVAHTPLLYCLFAFLACMGFCLPYNVHGVGGLLCCLGGALGWGVYQLTALIAGQSVYLCSLAAAVSVAVYAECMARLRKYPATSYLVISFLPLVPGFTIYQAMEYSLRGDSQQFLETFIRTFGIAGCLALGTLLVSTALRIIRTRKEPRHETV